MPMQPDARAALEEQLDEEGRLWTQNPQRLREVLAEGSARAKIPALSPHALRHTFGTRWLQAGGDIYKLSKILGHSSVGVTEAHYAHLLSRCGFRSHPGARGTWSACRGEAGCGRPERQAWAHASNVQDSRSHTTTILTHRNDVFRLDSLIVVRLRQ